MVEQVVAVLAEPESQLVTWGMGNLESEQVSRKLRSYMEEVGHYILPFKREKKIVCTFCTVTVRAAIETSWSRATLSVSFVEELSSSY